jgi:hypothetical protein
VSRIGDGWLWYAIIVWAAESRKARRHVRIGADDRRRAPSTCSSNRIVKRWIARPRPYPHLPLIRACARSLDEFSFPSGHTLHSDRVKPDPDRVLPDARAVRLAVQRCWSRSRASFSGCTTRAMSSSAR